MKNPKSIFKRWVHRDEIERKLQQTSEDLRNAVACFQVCIICGAVFYPGIDAPQAAEAVQLHLVQVRVERGVTAVETRIIVSVHP